MGFDHPLSTILNPVGVLAAQLAAIWYHVSSLLLFSASAGLGNFWLVAA